MIVGWGWADLIYIVGYFNLLSPCSVKEIKREWFPKCKMQKIVEIVKPSLLNPDKIPTIVFVGIS